MSLPLLLGLFCLAGAITLSLLAATSHPVAPPLHPGLASIERYYSRGWDAEAAQVLLGAPLSGPMLTLRRLAGRLSPADALSKIQRRMDVAGNPRRWTAERVLAFKGLGLIGLAVLGLLFGIHSAVLVVVFAVIGGSAGFFLPDILIYNTGLKRQDKLRRGLPDALDMMTICVEAGLGFDASMAQVARNTDGPVAAEFARVLQEMQFGKSRVQALRAMTDRTTVTELKTFISALVQGSDLGIPIATVLREQANEMRIRRRQRGEEQAQKVTVKILFPLIFCLFPALMIVVIGPGALNIVRMFSNR